jgi:hypothetical protein
MAASNGDDDSAGGVFLGGDGGGDISEDAGSYFSRRVVVCWVVVCELSFAGLFLCASVARGENGQSAKARGQVGQRQNILLRFCRLSTEKLLMPSIQSSSTASYPAWYSLSALLKARGAGDDVLADMRQHQRC